MKSFSCKGHGVCPSCGTRRMAATAMRLVGEVLPRVLVRQWILSVPKRLRFHLHSDPLLAGAVLRIVLRAVERELRGHCPDALPGARTGAVSFIQRFGGALNTHLHTDADPQPDFDPNVDLQNAVPGTWFPAGLRHRWGDLPSVRRLAARLGPGATAASQAAAAPACAFLPQPGHTPHIPFPGLGPRRHTHTKPFLAASTPPHRPVTSKNC